MKDGPLKEAVILDIPGGYSFSWIYGDDEIQFTLTRFREDSKFGVTAELQVDWMEKEAIIGGLRFNLLSPQGRKGIVSRLIQLHPGVTPEDWADTIEQICIESLKRFRRGEPIIEINTYDDIKKPSYCIDPLLPEGQPTIIYGEPGALKSKLGLVIYIALILPWHDNELNLIVPEKPVPCMMLDWETDEGVMGWQIKELQRGMDLPDFSLIYRRCTASLVDDLDKIKSAITKRKIKAIIVDSLGAAVGGDLKDATSALRFFTALRELKVTSLIIAQTSKDIESKNKSIFGSAFFKYYARSVWEVKSTEDGDDVNVALFHRKANLSKLHQPLGYKFSFNGDAVKIKAADVMATPEFVSQMSATTQVIEELKMGPMTAEDLAETCGLTLNNVRVSLTRLKQKGIVITVGEGKWGLVTKYD